MARTNFAGPINEGSVQANTGTEFTPSKTRNVGFVTSTQSFYFDYTSINFTAMTTDSLQLVLQLARKPY